MCNEYRKYNSTEIEKSHNINQTSIHVLKNNMLLKENLEINNSKQTGTEINTSKTMREANSM